MRSLRVIAAVTVLAGSALTLTGCAFHAEAGRTTPAKSFASTVADGLEEQVGKRPVVDCGDESIVLVRDKVVHCDLWAEGDPDTRYAVASTISSVKGGDYHLKIKVAEEPED